MYYSGWPCVDRPWSDLTSIAWPCGETSTIPFTYTGWYAESLGNPSSYVTTIFTNQPGQNTTLLSAGRGIELVWQSSDLRLTTSRPITASTTSNPPSVLGPESPPLSSGAKAGIAIGVIVFCLGLGGILFIIWKQRRRGHEGTSPRISDEGNTDLPEVVHNASHLYPLNKSDGEGRIHRVELETKELIRRKPVAQVQHPPVEMEAAAWHIAELDVSHEPPQHELPTSLDFDSQQGRNKVEGESMKKN
jgi:hypothetical protein